LRYIYPARLLTSFFQEVRFTVNAITPTDPYWFEAYLYAADRALLGGLPAATLWQGTSPLLDELMHALYFSYYPLLISGVVLDWVGRPQMFPMRLRERVEGDHPVPMGVEQPGGIAIPGAALEERQHSALEALRQAADPRAPHGHRPIAEGHSPRLPVAVAIPRRRIHRRAAHRLLTPEQLGHLFFQQPLGPELDLLSRERLQRGQLRP